MYLYLRQARLTGDGELEEAKAVRARLEDAAGQPVHLWQTVYSPGVGTVSWTSWFADLGALEDRLKPLGSLGPWPADEVLYVLVHGEPDLDNPGNYLRSLRTTGTSGHFDRGLQAGTELAKRSEQLTGVPSLFIRALTGGMGTVAWLSTYDSLGDFQANNEKLLSGSTWLWYRDTQAEAAQSSAPSTSLHRRIVD